MAIDSAAKRRRAARGPIIPDGTIEAIDRAQIAGKYYQGSSLDDILTGPYKLITLSVLKKDVVFKALKKSVTFN